MHQVTPHPAPTLNHTIPPVTHPQYVRALLESSLGLFALDSAIDVLANSGDGSIDPTDDEALRLLSPAFSLATAAAELAMISLDLAPEDPADPVGLLPSLALTTRARHAFFSAYAHAYTLGLLSLPPAAPSTCRSHPLAIRKLLAVLPASATRDSAAALRTAALRSAVPSEMGPPCILPVERERLIRLAEALGLSAEQAEAAMDEATSGDTNRSAQPP